MSSKIIISATDGCGSSVELLINKKGHLVAGVRTCYDNYTGKTRKSYRRFLPGEVRFSGTRDQLCITGSLDLFRGTGWGEERVEMPDPKTPGVLALKGAIWSDDHLRVHCSEATMARLTKE